jgi:hypothetical protein
LAALWTVLPAAASAGPAALLDASEVGIRDDLAWLADRGLISLGLSTWPMPVSLVTSAIGARSTGDWSEADLDALTRIRDSLVRLDATAVVSLRVNSARHPVSDAGLAVRARNEVSAQVQAGTDTASLRLRLGVQQQSLASPPSQATLEGSYFALHVPGAVVTLGAVDRWWGPARSASPILGNAAPAIPTLTLRRSDESAPETPGLAWIGPWSYEVSVGRPRHYEPSGAATIGIRLTARPLPGLELGIGRFIYWGGEGQPRSLDSLLDALLGRSNIDDPSIPDPSNEIAGVDVRWALPTATATWIGYAHLAGEDEANATPSKWIATLGLQLKHATARHRIEWTAEGGDTRLGNLFGLHPEKLQAAYQHGTYVKGHYHQGLPIGAFIGGGGLLASIGVAVIPINSPSALRYAASLWTANVSQHGSEPINAAYGLPGRVNGLSLQSSGMTNSLRWRVGLALQHRPDGAESGRRTVGIIGGIELPLREP